MQPGPDLIETTTAAEVGAKRRLSTKEKVKALMGVSGAADDALIDQLIDQVSADCVTYCGLAADSAGGFATFGAETLRATWYNLDRYRDDILLMPWRPAVSVSKVVENGVELEAGVDYRLIAGGQLQRLCGGVPMSWPSCWSVVVTMTAGWVLPDGAPPGLEGRVIDQVRMQFTARRRDPAIRSESTPDVGAASYSVAGGDSIGSSGLLAPLEAALAPYYRPALA